MWAFFLAALMGSWAAASGSSEVWNHVDVAAVVCPGGKGWAQIQLPVPPTDSRNPFIFTFFRTSNETVSLSFRATDALGKVLEDTNNITLQAVSAGPGKVAARRLSSRRRSSSSYSSPRRRSPSPSYSSPRRRAPSSYSSPRRRAPSSSESMSRRRSGSGSSYSAPRRRGFAQTGDRRRSTTYDQRTYSNPAVPGTGSYGYGSQSMASQRFGGQPPMATPYGYTGANAYRGSSGATIALAGAGGVLAGYAAGSMFSHWQHNGQGGVTSPWDMNCSHGASSWFGTCRTCSDKFGANTCTMLITPPINATRDDLMSTGFIPADYTYPLSVNITAISGQEFAPALICPPPGLITGVSWWPTASKELFLTLSAVDEIGEGEQTWWSRLKEEWGFHLIVLGVGCTGVCGCCCIYCRRKPKKGRIHQSDLSESELESSGSSSYGSYENGGDGEGFMHTTAPNGQTWEDYCHAAEPAVNNQSGFPEGRWGECIAWAKVYEHQNRNWHHEPQYEDNGPCGQVIDAMWEAAPDHRRQALANSAEKLEIACQACCDGGRPLPIINQRA